MSWTFFAPATNPDPVRTLKYRRAGHGPTLHPVKVHVLPALQPGGLALGQAGAHGKIGLGQEHAVAIVGGGGIGGLGGHRAVFLGRKRQAQMSCRSGGPPA